MIVIINKPQKIVMDIVDGLTHEYDAEECRLKLYLIEDVCIGSGVISIWDETRVQVNIDPRLFDTLGVHI